MLKMILIFHIQLCLKMDFPYELIVSVVLDLLCSNLVLGSVARVIGVTN